MKQGDHYRWKKSPHVVYRVEIVSVQPEDTSATPKPGTAADAQTVIVRVIDGLRKGMHAVAHVRDLFPLTEPEDEPPAKLLLRPAKASLPSPRPGPRAGC